MGKKRRNEMVQSLAILFNRVEEENKIPIQWRETKIKSVYKGGNKERIQESQRGIFLMNIVCKVYERVKKLQNENKQENISSMQTAGKKNRSIIDNLIIMNAIIEKQRQDNKNTYILYADAEKCFDKLWLKDSLIEMERIGYNKSDIKMLCEINKTTEIVADTAIGNTESIEITEVVKQGSIFGLTMRFATTAKVNDVGEKIWGDRKRNFNIYVGIRKCAKMEVQKKMKYSLDKTKYMVIRTGKEMEEDVSEQVKAGNIKKYKRSIYLGITINEEENLKGDIEE